MNASVHPPVREPDWLTGQILVAMPGMRDPRFNQSVIFICAHTADGAMGLVVNRPLERPAFGDLLKQLNIEPTDKMREIRLGTGGPVDEERGFVLHSADWSVEGSLEVDDDYVLTASLDILQAIAAGDGPTKGFLALGYANWGAGQLDEEMLHNVWLTVPADEAIVFGPEDRTKWQRALAKLKIDPGMLSGDSGRA